MIVHGTFQRMKRKLLNILSINVNLLANTLKFLTKNKTVFKYGGRDAQVSPFLHFPVYGPDGGGLKLGDVLGGASDTTD